MGLISKHGGYKNLKSFQMAEIAYDLTFEFTRRYVSSLKQKDQIEGAARGGKQNISEGSQTSGTSKQSELRLVSVARASLEELLNDYRDFLRTNKFEIWNKEHTHVLAIRKLAYVTDKSYKTYMSYMTNPESAANCLLCIIHQANFLLDQQIRSLEKDLMQNGDYKERYTEVRKQGLKHKTFDGFNMDDYDAMLKQQGLKRLPNGQVVEDKQV